MHFRGSLITFSILFITALGFIKPAYCIKCFVCEGTKECKNATLWECNKTLANYTQMYLDKRYRSVPWFHVSYIECYSELVTIFTDKDFEDYPFKGCIYSNLKACSLPFKDNLYSPEERSRECKQCDWDMCNKSTMISENLTILFLTLVIALKLSQL